MSKFKTKSVGKLKDLYSGDKYLGRYTRLGVKAVKALHARHEARNKLAIKNESKDNYWETL